jgi:hypothetical protein
MTRIVRGLAALLLLLVLHAGAAAQTPSPQESWRARAAEIAKLRAAANLDMTENIEKAVDINLNFAPFVLFAYELGLTRDRLLEDARNDKQLGAPASATGGSTSLVSKAGVPAIFAFAVEHGALTQTVNDTSVTLRGNAVGWLDLLQNQDVVASYDDDSSFTRALRRFSYSFTFDAAPTAPAPTEERPTPEQIEKLSEDAQKQLTAWSVRVSLIDQRDPRRSDNRASIKPLMQGAGVDLLAASAFLDPVVNSPEYRVWLQGATVALAGQGAMDEADVERVLYTQLEKLRQIAIQRIPDFDAGVVRFVKALRTFDGARTAYFKKLQQRFIMAAEMVRNRPPSKAATSTFRIIADGKPGKSLWDLTGNFAVTYQDAGTALVPDPVPTAGWRDIQFAFLAERPLSKLPSLGGGAGIGPPVFAFEYLSRKLFDKAVVTFAGHDFSVEPGWIHALQARITIPVKGSGMKVPLSVSYANRTELLSEKTVRAHFGFTFDLDVLASAVRR